MIKFAYSDKYIYELPKGHRFPIEKYELVKEQLLLEGTIEENQIFDPGLASDEQILNVHTAEYWNHLKSLTLDDRSVRKIGLPVTSQSVKRARSSVAGTIAAARNALQYGVGVNLAGGTHHAYADSGEGFCALNDIAISAIDIQSEQLVKKILIVDLDVHQGNGTAKIFENELNVFTFSMHCENNYPMRKEKSDLDISLPLGTENRLYLDVLKNHLPKLIADIKPEIIYFQAGVDVLESDKLGKFSLTKEGVTSRDEIVIKLCVDHNIPLIVTMGGGYTKLLRELVDVHCNTFRKVIHFYT